MCDLGARGLALALLSLFPAMYGVLCAANYLAMPPDEPELLVAASEFRPNLPPLRPVGVAASARAPRTSSSLRPSPAARFIDGLVGGRHKKQF